MSFLNKVNEWVAKVEAFFLCIFLMTMVILAFSQVVMRDVFNAGLPWADSLVRLMVIWVGFLGASLATRLEQNLTVEVLTKFLSPSIKTITSIVVKMFAIMVCFFLFEASLRFIASERSTGEKFIHLIPSWWTLTIIPATFILIPFHFILSIVNEIVGKFGSGKPASGKPDSGRDKAK